MKPILRYALAVAVLLFVTGCFAPSTQLQQTPPIQTTLAASVKPVPPLATPTIPAQPLMPSPATPSPTLPSTKTPLASPPRTLSPTPPGSPIPSSDPTGQLEVHFINVGQGDSILIRSPDGKTMLIDGGEADSGALQYLKSKGINSLDVMLATHPHADHIGGLVQVLKAMPVSRVVTSGQPTTTRTYENFLDAIASAKAEYVEVKRGDTIRLGDLVFAVMNPVSRAADDLNNGSIVLRLVHGRTSFLFTGDAEKPAEGSMSVSSFSPVQANILKVGHHGSRTGIRRSRYVRIPYCAVGAPRVQNVMRRTI